MIKNFPKWEFYEFTCASFPILCAGYVARLDSENHRIHEVLGSLDQRRGRVEAGDDQLPGHVLDVGLHLAGDIQLVAVEGDTLQIRDQILLGAGLRALVSDGSVENTEYFLVQFELVALTVELHF